MVDLPAKIADKSFVQDVVAAAAVHGDVVLETVAAQVAEQLLQARDAADAYAALAFEGVVSELAEADIGLNAALRVIGADSGVCERSGG